MYGQWKGKFEMGKQWISKCYLNYNAIQVHARVYVFVVTLEYTEHLKQA